jgi:phosphoglycolate phosphatase
LGLLIFDLDGTLIDSSFDLVLSTNAMLRHLGRQEIDAAAVTSYVGDGAPKLVRRALGQSVQEDEFETAYRYFIRYYREHALDHTDLYPGMRDAIRQLHNRGNTLAVLTNKPAKISEDILNGLQVAPFFFRIYGGDSFPTKKPDPTGVSLLIKEAGVTQGQTTVIGDTSVDIRTAKAAAVRSCGVTWGFKPESLYEPPADLLVKDPGELVELLSAQQE